MKDKSGFTLMELMVTIAIFSILSGIAAYSYLSGLPERRAMSASRDLYAGVQESRSEAVGRGEGITITFNTGQESYTITDSGGNQIAEHDFPDYINLSAVTGDDNFFTFDSSGRITNLATSEIVKLHYDKSGQRQWGVRVTPAGGITLIDETNENWK
jgi:type IV fimbrial biogenesis protein FimT